MADSVSRRIFLSRASIGVAGGLLAGAAVTSGIPLGQLFATAGPASDSSATPDLTPLGEDVVAHLRDGSDGEVSLLVGGREIVYRDPELVDRLLSGVRRVRSKA